MTVTQPAISDTPPRTLAALVRLGDNAKNLQKLLEQLRTPVGIVPFVGAGMSVPFGYPAWRPFLEAQASDDSTKQHLVALLDRGKYEEAAEALLATRGAEVFQAILGSVFGQDRLPQPLPAAAMLQLPRLCSGPVLTTNFDPVLEEVFANARRPFEKRILGMDVKAIREGFAQSRRVLVKLHGDAADQHSRVLTKSDYERAYGDGEPLKPVLQFVVMQARPLLFLGCSLNNDRTVHVMEALAGELRRQKAADLLEHYALVDQPGDDVEFAARHERLKHLGLLPIWYPTGQHGMVAELLAYLAAKAGRNVVSGSVPAQPSHYLARDAEVAALRAKVLAGGGGYVAITGQARAAGVQGMGGVGKTVLAAALTRDPGVQRVFPDGIFWVTVSRKPKVLDLLNKLGQFMPACDGGWTETAVAQAKLRDALSGKRALLILDDVWDANHAQALNVVSAPAGRLLVTTRQRGVLAALGADEFQVNVLSPDGALRMLANWAGESSPERLPPVAADVARECGYLPLALAMIGTMVKLRPKAWADALELLRSHDLAEFQQAFPDYPYPDLLRAIAVGVDELPAADRKRYLDLAVFPEDQAISEGPLQVLWGLPLPKTRTCIGRLVARSLATWQEVGDQGAMLLHDLQSDFVRNVRKRQLFRLHTRFLHAYGALCSRRSPKPDSKSPLAPGPHHSRFKTQAPWCRGPNDGYFFQHLAWHLTETRRKAELRKLLLDYEWVWAKLNATDTTALLTDYDYLPKDEDLRLVQSAIRLSAHVPAMDSTQLAAQLLGRLIETPSPAIRGFIIGTRSAINSGGPAFLPTNQCLTAPGGALVRSIDSYNEDVWRLALADTRKCLLSASRVGPLRIWDPDTGTELGTLDFDKNVSALSLSGDGRIGVIAGTDDTSFGLSPKIPDVSVFDIVQKRFICYLRGHSDEVSALSQTPDGTLVLTGSRDRSVKLWASQSGRCLATFRGHTDWVYSVAISADGRIGISVSGDNTLIVWDIKQQKKVWSAKHDLGRPPNVYPNKGIFSVAMTTDARFAVTSGLDCTIRYWGIKNRRELYSVRENSDVREVGISSDGRSIIFPWFTDLCHWRPGNREGTMIRYNEHADFIHDAKISADGTCAISCDSGGTIKIWDLTQGQTRRKQHHDGRVEVLEIAPDGKSVLTGSGDHTVKLWERESLSCQHVLNEHRESIVGVGFLPDRQGIITADREGTILRWTCVRSCWKSEHIKSTRSWLHSMIVSPNEPKVFWTSFTNNAVTVYDCESGVIIDTLRHTEVHSLAISPDGRWLVSSSMRVVKLWDLTCRQSVKVLRRRHDDPNEGFGQPAVCGDARRVICSWCNSLLMWDPNSNTVNEFGTGGKGLLRVAISKDGQLGFSTSWDQQLTMWDLDLGRSITSFLADERLYPCKMAPDEKSLVVGDYSGRLLAFDLVGLPSPIGRPVSGSLKDAN